jgi:hypothetical protein
MRIGYWALKMRLGGADSDTLMCMLGLMVIKDSGWSSKQQAAMDKDDTEPKALACYGLLVRWTNDSGDMDEKMWLRFVDGRPVSAITIEFLRWCCDKLEAANKGVLLMVWDNAPWHISRAVKQWVREHNRQVKRTSEGVRILSCTLPVRSPWLNPIEPKWVHAKRRVVEPTRALRARELAQRVCATFNCTYEQHLSIPEKVV